MLRIDPEKVQPEQLADLKSRCNTSDATHALTFIVVHPEGNRLYSTMIRVASSATMTKYLSETFGESNVLLDTER